MNCNNCGAPMELFERRRYYVCRHCGSFHFLDAPTIDGLQVLERLPARVCSICRATMSRALLDQSHPIEYCEKCRGVLMARRTFAEVIARRRAWASNTPSEPLPIDRQELERHIPCPSCQARMEVHPYYGPGNVVIDSCGACDLVWLDFGEMQQIVDAPGRDRGRREGPPPGAGETPIPDPRLIGSGPRGGTLLDVLDQLLS